MKIREMILTLIKSGQDFSDHGMFVGTGGEMGPMHDENCAFCDAWRTALYLLTDLHAFDGNFEPGDPVLICGRAPGFVVRVRTRIDVRLGVDGDSPRPIGTFDSQFVQRGPTREFYADAQGDLWEHDVATGAMLCIEQPHAAPGVLEELRAAGPAEWPWSKVNAEKMFGPMKRVERP